MIFKHVFLEEFSALFALIELLRTNLQVNVHVALLDSLPTVVRAVRLKVIDQFLKAHIRFEALWQLLLAARALPLVQALEAMFANDVSALHAVEGNLGQFETNNAL